MYIDSMQKAVNDVIDIFISEDMENMYGLKSLLKHVSSTVYNEGVYFALHTKTLKHTKWI